MPEINANPIASKLVIIKKDVNNLTEKNTQYLKQQLSVFSSLLSVCDSIQLTESGFGFIVNFKFSKKCIRLVNLKHVSDSVKPPL